MSKFKDAHDREWDIDINGETLAWVEKDCKLYLPDLVVVDQMKGLQELLSRPLAMIGVLGALCREQIARLPSGAKSFGSGFKGDVLDHAANALMESLTDFFQSAAIRAALRKVIKATEVVKREMEKELRQWTDELDPEAVGARIAKSLSREKSNATSLVSPESAESTLDAAP